MKYKSQILSIITQGITDAITNCEDSYITYLNLDKETIKFLLKFGFKIENEKEDDVEYNVIIFNFKNKNKRYEINKE